MKNTTIAISPEVKDKLDQLCDKYHRTQKAQAEMLIIEAYTRMLIEQENKNPA